MKEVTKPSAYGSEDEVILHPAASRHCDRELEPPGAVGGTVVEQRRDC